MSNRIRYGAHKGQTITSVSIPPLLHKPFQPAKAGSRAAVMQTAKMLIARGKQRKAVHDTIVSDETAFAAAEERALERIRKAKELLQFSLTELNEVARLKHSKTPQRVNKSLLYDVIHKIERCFHS